MISKKCAIHHKWLKKNKKSELSNKNGEWFNNEKYFKKYS